MAGTRLRGVGEIRVRSLGLRAENALGLVRRIKAGLPYSALTRFQAASKLPEADIARNLRLPKRSQARRKAAGRLSALEAERLVRLALLFDKAEALFEDDAAAAARWLQTPQKALGEVAPLECAETEIGARAVEDLIGRLEHGVYS